MAKNQPKEKVAPAAEFAAATSTAISQPAIDLTDTNASEAGVTVNASRAAGVLQAVFNVRAVGLPRRCRAGLCFTEKGQSVDFSTLTEHQVKAIAADPHLKIYESRLTPLDEDLASEDDAAQTEAE